MSGKILSIKDVAFVSFGIFCALASVVFFSVSTRESPEVVSKTTPNGIRGTPSCEAGFEDKLAEASRLAISGDAHQALAACDRLLVQAPSDHRPLLLRAEICLASGYLAKASVAAESAVLRSPENLDCLLMRVRTSMAFGQRASALVDIDSIIDDHPLHSEALFRRGMIYFADDLYEDALRDFNACISVGGERELSAAFFNRSKTCAALGRFSEAVKDMNRFSELTEDPLAVRESRKFIEEWKLTPE